MAGVTDTVFRRFIRNLGGCGLMMTEFTSADGIVRHKDKKAKQYLTFYGNEHPISAQLFGSDPATLADAARVVQDLGFDRGRPEPGLSGKEGCEVQWRLGTVARPAAHPQHLRVGPLGRDDPVHGEVPRRLERQGSGAHQSGEDGPGVRAGCGRLARSHPRAGLQRAGELGVDCRGERRADDSRDRQRRCALA
jgi:hypothetical protein